MKRISHLLIAKKSVVARKSVVEKRRVVEKIRASVSYFMLGLSVVMLFMTGKPVFAESELLIEITSGRIDSTKIAVVPFRWSGRGVLDEDVARIIGADLERSGQFQSMGRSNMLSRPSRASEVLFEEWRTMGMEYLVIGEILDVEGNQFEFNFQLFDVFSGELLEERRGRAGNLRDISHHIADKIYEKLTGLRGAFSTKLLYISVNKLRPGHMDYRLQIADADGFRPRTIQQSNEPILSPAWSPDGKKVAYSTYFNRKPAIFIQDLASGQRQKVSAFKGINGAPDWSPDGRHLAMTLSKDGNAEIYLLELATERWTRVTNHYAIDTEPRWSPDGQYLIFTSNRGGSVQIYRYLLADRTVSRMTYEGSYNARGDISHDGQYLVMVHRRKGQFHIAIQDIDKRTLNILSETALDESPTIAPNGSMLIYATLDGDQGILSAVSFDGRVKFRIPSRRGDVREPSWSPFL